jgi:hypothetical protein
VKAWTSGKPATTRSRAVRFGTVVDNYRGASGLERGAHSLRGENSEGGIPGTVAARNKVANPEACQETAERLGKPESGTGVRVTTRFTWGSPRGTPLKGPETSRESDSTDRSDGQEAVRDFRGD